MNKEAFLTHFAMLVIGIVIGWVANEKWDWIKDKAVFWKK